MVTKVKPQQIVIRSIQDYNEKIKDVSILKDSISIYTRVSTKGQIDNFSIKDQISSGMKYVKSLKLKNVIIWREEGVSGDDTSNRSEEMTDVLSRELMREIIKLVDEGFITRMWVNDMSRLSRNEEISMYLKSKFYSNGMELHVGNQLYDFDNLNDKLMFGVLSVFNEYENNLRYSKSVSGKMSKLKTNGWIGGKPNFGFKIVNGKLVEDTEHSNTIRKIYEWYGVDNKSIKWIQNELMVLGIKSPRGNTMWNMVSLRNLLRNEVYIGKQKFQLRLLKGKSIEYCKKKGKLFEYEVELEDKIISDSLWKCVNEKHKRYMRTSRQQSNQKVNKYLLSGLLYCYGCDGLMSGKIQPSQVRFLYHCTNKTNVWKGRIDKKCTNSRSVNLNVLESLIWGSTVDVWSNSYTIKEKFKKDFLLPKIKDKKDVSGGLSKKLKVQSRLHKEISDFNENLKTLYKDRMLNKIEESVYKDIVKSIGVEIKEREKKIIVINSEITMLKKQDVWFNWLDDFEVHINDIKTWNKEDDFEKMKEFLNKVIKRIDLMWDKESNLHQLKISYQWNIYQDKRGKKGKWKFNIQKGKSERLSSKFSSRELSLMMNKENQMSSNSYSTVTDFAKFLG